MRFNDPTLYGRDDETDEYSDSGAYGESLEEDLEEEEEEEEEPVLVEEDDEIPVVPEKVVWSFAHHVSANYLLSGSA